MPIIYEKLRKRLKEIGITSYTVRKNQIVGQAAWNRIQKDGDINTRTIETFCKILNCQPGDLLEYVSEEPDNKPEDPEEEHIILPWEE